MKVTVAIPVYNELPTIEELLSRVLASPLPFEKEVLVVDDGSNDGTREWLKSQRWPSALVRVVCHEKNRGKGAALRTAFAIATGDIVIIQDADLEYDPREYSTLLLPILENKADVVFGSRFLGGPHRVLFFWHYVGNRFLTLLCNAVSNLNLTDVETCYKAFRRPLLNGLKFESNRFGFEPEFAIKMAQRKARIYEIPVSYNGRNYAEGKKAGWRDGVEAIFIILRFALFKQRH